MPDEKKKEPEKVVRKYPGLTNDRVKPYLDGHLAGDPAATAEFKKGLVVNGPQEHDGVRYEGVVAQLDWTGRPTRGLPMDNANRFLPGEVRIVATPIKPPADQ